VEATKAYELFALLQLNSTAMTGRAAFISVVDLHKEGAISRKRVSELISPYHVKQIESDVIDRAAQGQSEGRTEANSSRFTRLILPLVVIMTQ